MVRRKTRSLGAVLLALSLLAPAAVAQAQGRGRGKARGAVQKKPKARPRSAGTRKVRRPPRRRVRRSGWSQKPMGLALARRRAPSRGPKKSTPASRRLRLERALDRSSALVLDLDNTLFDTRPRTVAAVHRFAESSRRLSRAERTKLLAVDASQVGYDAAETAARLGLKGATAEAFEKVWSEVFWDPRSVHLDEPMPETMALLERAANKKVYFLSARWDQPARRAETMKKLAAHGLEGRGEVLLKPPGEEGTPRFKRRFLARLAKKERILYLDDSPSSLAEVSRARLPLTPALVESPVRERGGPAVPEGVLRLPIQ